LSAQDREKIALNKLFLKRSTIPEMKAGDIEGVLDEVVEPLVVARVIKPGLKKEIVEILLERESQGSTGVGGGAAIPHAAVEDLDGVYGVLGRSVAGVDFNCVTGEKVHVFFLVLYPPEMQRERRLVLGRILELCRKGNFVKFLKAARNVGEMSELLCEVDGEA